MSNNRQVFQADSSRRWTTTVWLLRTIGFLAVFALVVAIITIVRASNPTLPDLNDAASAFKKKTDPDNPFTFTTPQNKKYKGFKDFLFKRISGEHSVSRDTSTKTRIRGAFYTPWDKNSLTDLREHGSNLTTIYPEWFFIDTITHLLQTRIDTAALSVMREQRLSIEPIINNFSSGLKNDFDPALANAILNDEAHQQKFIANLIDTLKHYRFQGINLDFEELQIKSNDELSNFVKRLGTSLHQNNMRLTVDIAIGNEDYDPKVLSDYADQVILMAYDQYNDAIAVGPISSQKWIEAELDQLGRKVPASKIILGVAGYAREWINDGEETEMKDITYNAAINNAKLSGSAIEYDNDTYNLHYKYEFTGSRDEPRSTHSVWFTDAATTFNTLRFSDEYGTAGTALWRLGGEDMRIWKFYGRDLSDAALRAKPFDFALLREVPVNYDEKPTAVGQGELLNVLYNPQAGRISMEIDSAENLIAEQKYEALPSGYVYEKLAEDTTPIGPGHKIILTFDDGPDPRYTKPILDILEKENIPATFFLVGLQAEQNIPLVQRIAKDGFEIGNHTFTHGNVARISPQRAALELRTTRSLIECITGRSTILFRAPYNADSEPQTFEEIEPIALSKKDNYITVGESIDPNDWDPHNNADSIVARTIRQANENNASIILLHDAGGETRAETVKALPRIIKYFKDKGCKFTTVADLAGLPRDKVMPPIKQSFKNRLNFFLASFSYWSGLVVFSLFLIGIFLSIARMLFVGILASIEARRENKLKAVMPPITTYPEVSVIVPAYNEEVNAIRTVESLLQQDYPNLRIVFVDDGSKDKTYEVVKNAFAGNEKVDVLTKPNGGKASALNYGIGMTTAPFVVCIDADTQLKKDAVRLLIKRILQNPHAENVGAVAGNVKVGNEINMITRWQSIEYITSQNFDRRAFGLLNCITVVPGALGAFRREAILNAGGFTTDTLAEDCDLTMRLHKCGYIILNCNDAISYTEAPETVSQFLKQRFRWSFGTMQAFWKHRDAIFRNKYRNFGMIALPNILLYQLILPFLAPLADLLLIISLVASGLGLIPTDAGKIVLYWLIFTGVDILGAAIAFSFEKESLKKLIYMLPQRLIYRQLMYYILFKSIRKAMKGELQGWGALKRTGNVQVTTKPV